MERFANYMYDIYLKEDWGYSPKQSDSKVDIKSIIEKELELYNRDYDCSIAECTSSDIYTWGIPQASACDVNTYSYVHYQTSTSYMWTINHDLGWIPNVYTTDLNGNPISGVITTLNTKTIIIEFSQPISGRAYLS